MFRAVVLALQGIIVTYDGWYAPIYHVQEDLLNAGPGWEPELLDFTKFGDIAGACSPFLLRPPLFLWGQS